MRPAPPNPLPDPASDVSYPEPEALAPTVPAAPVAPLFLHSSTPPLAALSPRHTQLLASLLALDFNLKALAEKHTLSELELLHFTADPALRTALLAVRAVADLTDALHHRARRRKAIDTLIEIIETTADAVEKRKAATSLLRNTAPPTNRAADRCAERSVLPTHDPADPFAPDLVSCSTDANPRRSPRKPPRADSSPDLLLARLAGAFHPQTGDTDTAIDILRSALAPEAHVNSRSVPKNPAAFRSLANEELRPLLDSIALIPAGGIGGAFTRAEDVFALSSFGETTHYTFDFAAVHEDRWRITRITAQRECG